MLIMSLSVALSSSLSPHWSKTSNLQAHEIDHITFEKLWPENVCHGEVIIIPTWQSCSQLFHYWSVCRLITKVWSFVINRFIVWSIKCQKVVKNVDHRFPKWRPQMSCFVHYPKRFSLLSQRTNETRKHSASLKNDDQIVSKQWEGKQFNSCCWWWAGWKSETGGRRQVLN